MTFPTNFDQYQPATTPFAVYNPRASRAGILLLILGLLTASLGLCNTITTFRTSPQDLLAQQSKILPPDQPMPVSAETMRTVAAIMGIAVSLTGFLLIGLGLAVRAGSATAAVFAVVVTGIILAGLVLFLLIATVAAFAAPAAAALLCVLIVPTVLFSLNFIWLIQASRAARGASHMQSQYAQYWQYYQQQQQQSQQSGPYTPPAPLTPPPQYFPPSQPPPPPSPLPPDDRGPGNPIL
jgi:hypothetical protein